VTNRPAAYDDPRFHARYADLRRRGAGINEAVEQPSMRRFFEAVAGLDVIDLGCGEGELCRAFARQGAASVIGVDASERMLAAARRHSDHAAVRYERASIEEVVFPDASADLVVSALALHYVQDLDAVFRRVARWLRHGGRLVASMEHPVVSAPLSHPVADGPWPLEAYADEGPRRRRWLGGDVTKHHRTTATIVGALLAAGFRLDALDEPAPSPEAVVQRPELAVHRQRPAVLVLAASCHLRTSTAATRETAQRSVTFAPGIEWEVSARASMSSTVRGLEAY